MARNGNEAKRPDVDARLKGHAELGDADERSASYDVEGEIWVACLDVGNEIEIWMNGSTSFPRPRFPMWTLRGTGRTAWSFIATVV